MLHPWLLVIAAREAQAASRAATSGRLKEQQLRTIEIMRALFIPIVAFAFVLPASPQPAKLEPIAIALPKPLFEGTPVPTNVPNLEKPSKNPRPPFLAPAGTVNLALHKPVTSSDSDPVIGNLEMITDGNKAGTDGTFVELKQGSQSVVIDLERRCTIYAILVWHYHKEARSYSDVVVQVADDPDFIVNVRTLFNNDGNNESGNGIGKDQRYVETNEGRLIDARGAEAVVRTPFSFEINSSNQPFI